MSCNFSNRSVNPASQSLSIDDVVHVRERRRDQCLLGGGEIDVPRRALWIERIDDRQQQLARAFGTIGERTNQRRMDAAYGAQRQRAPLQVLLRRLAARGQT